MLKSLRERLLNGAAAAKIGKRVQDVSARADFLWDCAACHKSMTKLQ